MSVRFDTFQYILLVQKVKLCTSTASYSTGVYSTESNFGGEGFCDM